MSYGLNILNNSGTIQINQDLRAAKLAASGTTSTYLYADVYVPGMGADTGVIILVKPNNVNQFITLFSCYPIDNNNYRLFISADSGGFTWAVFSSLTTSPVTETTAHGLEVYTSNGSIAYSSKHKHPQITHLCYKPSIFTGYCQNWTYQNAGWNDATYAISGYTSMPWLLMNNLAGHAFGVGPYSDQSPCYGGKVNTGYTSVTFDLLGGDAGYYPGTGYDRLRPAGDGTTCQFDLYNYIYPQGVWFGVGKYD